MCQSVELSRTQRVLSERPNVSVCVCYLRRISFQNPMCQSGSFQNPTHHLPETQCVRAVSFQNPTLSFRIMSERVCFLNPTRERTQCVSVCEFVEETHQLPEPNVSECVCCPEPNASASGTQCVRAVTFLNPTRQLSRTQCVRVCVLPEHRSCQ